MTLPPVTARYFELEFEGAFAKNDRWDGEVWLAWNNLMNNLANEGEQLLVKEESK